MADTAKVMLMAGVMILGTAVLVPTLIDSSNNDAKDVRNASIGEQQELTDVLFMEVKGTNATSGTANVSYMDSRSLETNETQTAVGNTTTVRVSGETVDYKVKSVTNSTATIQTVYDPKFGWDKGSRTYFDNMGIILAILGFMGVVAVIVKVLP